MNIKLSTQIRNKMRKDIEEINSFPLAETEKWSDKEVAEYYASSMQNSLFMDGQRQSELMAKLLKQAGLSVA